MVSRRWLDVSGGSFYPGGKYVSRPPADWISINEIVSKNNKQIFSLVSGGLKYPKLGTFISLDKVVKLQIIFVKWN